MANVPLVAWGMRTLSTESCTTSSVPLFEWGPTLISLSDVEPMKTLYANDEQYTKIYDEEHMMIR